jgi:phage shock protein PspC (stress-responsive transcriptional regulator)
MQKVIIINLNGNAYQLDEDAYHTLRAYLDNAGAQLAANPDKAEILGDLEQAIGEKCGRFLGPHKTVVSVLEIDQVLKEMGPVDPSAGATDATGTKAAAAADAPKRLYRIRETGMIAGICAGFGAYFDLDPTIIRIIFVLLTVLTHGVWMLVYIVLMFVIPVANTSEERAAAQGLPFTAQELVDQAKTKYSAFRDKALSKQWWKPKKKVLVAPIEPHQLGYGRQLLLGIVVATFAIVRAAATVLLVLAIVSLVNNGRVLQFHLPPDVPLWVGILLLVLLYQMSIAPLRIARHAWSHNGWPYGHVGAEVSGGIIWLGFLILFLWFAYEHEPMFRDFLHRLPIFEHRWLQEVRNYFFVETGWARGAGGGAMAGDS